ncbi:MAG: hypothetical protein A2W80_06335 [Candidatus Riflebacteria bacterium GWC2_50_8]|nr:MAG: hypothetical protein A2W80_06335 [Candidatus Riflebacteria bacterium GWC2_50_8]
MKKIRYILLMILLFPALVLAEGQVCPACGAEELASLAMVCPECGVNLHSPLLKAQQKPRARLRIRLLYTGGNPDKMPNYGKLYINGTYLGNIDMIEKQSKIDDYAQIWSNGLGKDFTAYYEKVVDSVPAGVLKVEVEMKFSRFYGLGSSLKRVVFPYTSFSSGENTSLDHYFSSPSTFNQHKPVKAPPIPIVSEAKLQGASGTVAHNVPLFE